MDGALTAALALGALGVGVGVGLVVGALVGRRVRRYLRDEEES